MTGVLSLSRQDAEQEEGLAEALGSLRRKIAAILQRRKGAPVFSRDVYLVFIKVGAVVDQTDTYISECSTALIAESGLQEGDSCLVHGERGARHQARGDTRLRLPPHHRRSRLHVRRRGRRCVSLTLVLPTYRSTCVNLFQHRSVLFL